MADWIATAFEMFKQQREDVDILHDLLSAGCPRDLSEKLLVFIPHSCGRVILADIGTPLSGNFRCLLSDGSVGPSRPLNSDPDWVAIDAFIAARRSTEKDTIAIVGTRSAEFDAVNQALLNGSKPENLAPSDAIFAFTAASGLANAATTPGKKPWWAFWRSVSTTQ